MRQNNPVRYKRLVGTALISVFLTLVVLEIRQRGMPEAPLYNEVAAETHGPRLFDANLEAAYDITGLYEGASKVELHISQFNFIQPSGDLNASNQVLFLGGSTTEAIYVPENERWVALLNSPEIATFNGAQSGANILDELRTFDYLAALGWRFDWVVLSTSVNDFGWTGRIGRLVPETYVQDVQAWVDRTNPPLPFYMQIRLIHDIVRAHEPHPGLVESYQAAIADAMQAPLGTVDTCAAQIDRFREDAQNNIRLFLEHSAGIGAQLLVMNEASGYGAPADSFYTDLRSPVLCNGLRLSNADSQQVMEEVAHSYLMAAEQAGAAVFDLAGTMSPYTNGIDGGAYVYDSIHYTMTGSRQVAEVLRPVIQGLFN